MCDPIIDPSDNVEAEPFRLEVVEEYLKDKENFKKPPLRHYSQLDFLKR